MATETATTRTRDPTWTTDPGVAVLLIDDNDSVREVLALYAGARVSVCGEAANGRDGVALAERLQPDAIVLDEEMPVMTGLEALPLLRERVPHAVVVMYASGPPGTEQRARARRVPRRTTTRRCRRARSWPGSSRRSRRAPRRGRRPEPAAPRRPAPAYAGIVNTSRATSSSVLSSMISPSVCLYVRPYRLAMSLSRSSQR